MSNFPRPDNMTPREIPNREQEVRPHVAPPEATSPFGPTTDKDSTAFTANEIHFILRTTLLPEHHEDPNVLGFIREYMECRDPGQAAKAIGLHPASGRKLRARPDIHHTICKLTERSLMKYGFDAAEVVEKVKEIAFIDPIELENPDGSFKKLREMTPQVRRAIKKLKVKNLFDKDPNGVAVVIGEIIEIELHDKMKPIEMLGREKELFKETKKVEHAVTHNMGTILLEAKRRGDAAHQKVIDVTPNKTVQLIATTPEPGDDGDANDDTE